MASRRALCQASSLNGVGGARGISPDLEGPDGAQSHLQSLAIASSRSFTFRHEIQTPRVVKSSTMSSAFLKRMSL